MGKRFKKWNAADDQPARELAITQLPNWVPSWNTGDKWAGGFGTTELLITDYWTLRMRSRQLFEQNIYARGIIRRLVTNIVNTGLHLEANPEEALLGVAEDSLNDWAETVENRFQLWADSAERCDVREQQTFGALQAQAYLEALVDGDVLVTLRQDQATDLPRVMLISGSAVQTPFGITPQRGNRIVHGVELDSIGRHVAYWIYQQDGTSKRLPAWGEKSGRRLAWLVYGNDKRMDDVRGKPLLATVLQSLKEIDRYRDSVQRKAVINSMLAMWVQKGEDKPGSRPLTGAAVRRGVQAQPDGTNTPRRYSVAEQIPGAVVEELQHGETIHGFPSNGTDEKFGDFESAIIRAAAWHFEIPPEILELSFTNNYSASQAAINEFKIFMNARRQMFGESFCQPVYNEWLLSETLAKRVQAPRLVEAWRDSAQYVIFGAWIAADWSGQIKPSTDMLKQARGYEAAIAMGLCTRDRASRELTGTKYSKNVKKLRSENVLLVEANAAIAEAEAKAQAAKLTPAAGKQADGQSGASTKPRSQRLRSATATKGLTA